ncbi:PREDICTED: putative receptor-like protein kinase At2g30940 [Tarenaya hassleriana]|uniref:putative receptor-like protein kinase At2g30940 n=1 Tax=Tarenaya hassleriana TaxID=28532 RepID=UPI00053C9065|nr:PREDICTED: putative receptor-like protein kinase At2g30940 [Tarenaya hassleriana]
MRMNWNNLLLFYTFTGPPSSELERFALVMMKDIASHHHLSSSSSSSSSSSLLSKHTSFFGVELWVLIIAAGAAASLLAAVVVVLSLCLLRHRRWQEPFRITKPKFCLPLKQSVSPDRDVKPNCRGGGVLHDSFSSTQNLVPGRFSSTRSHSFSTGGFGSFNVFTFMEIQSMTDGFSDENLIAKGDSGFVYRGIFMGAMAVSVKRLSSNAQRSEAEEFMARAEMIANVRHKNVARLLGCCNEGAERVLVYEYVEKGDLQQWLYGSRGRVQPLSWRKRMNIIQGVAKGLAYFHEDIEPRITHRDMKPSKILLDYQWNPKMLGVGFTSNVPTFSTAAPLRSSPDARELKNDVHSFGVLIMEIVSGRVPVDQDLPNVSTQVYLVDWIKEMVTNHTIVNVLDPRLPEFPPVKELKRLILIALRCVDPDVEQRPKMGDVIHMLQPRDLLLSNVTEKLCLCSL